MTKQAAVTGATLLCSIAISFGAATQLLHNKLLYAVALITVYFFGGLWAPRGRIGTKTHALWIGISLGFFGAVLFFLPSSFA
jgi:hypothetical protein